MTVNQFSPNSSLGQSIDEMNSNTVREHMIPLVRSQATVQRTYIV